MQIFKFFWIGLLPLLLYSACSTRPEEQIPPPIQQIEAVRETSPDMLHFGQALTVRNWFAFIDSLNAGVDSTLPGYLDEYVLVHANPWLIDSFAATDFDVRLLRGDTVIDQRNLVIMESPIDLVVPSKAEADSIRAFLSGIRIDVNIPEFRFRLWHEDSLLFSVPARVGRHERQYLEMAGREVDLRTAVGEGQVVRINRYPDYIDPCSNKPYAKTRRDNGVITKMPLIPWIEPEIDGLLPGHLIHPTTNPSTLGNALSYGCIGLSEADAWRVYFLAPIGTQVAYRYDLEVIAPDGDDTIRLEDIYGLE